MATGAEILRQVFTSPSVTESLRNAPESWFASFLNSVMSSVPLQNLNLVPSTLLTILTALFAVFDPKTLSEFRGPEFYATPSNQLKTTYDYIIVGGGSAGCLLANRLSEKHVVLLIEAGTTTNLFNHVPRLNVINYREPAFDLDWLYHSTELKYAFQGVRDKKAHMGCGKGMGGSSHLNYQVYSRAWDEDYDRWERVYGAEGWNAKQMVNSMKKHEAAYGEPLEYLGDRHGTTGELSVTRNPLDEKRSRVAEALLKAGAEVTQTSVVEDHNAGLIPGFSLMQSTVEPSGSISNSARAFIDPIRKERKDRLHIMLNTMVEKVLLNDKNEAIGVEFLTVDAEGETRGQIKAKGEVILSAGSARSPQILKLSGIGPMAELEEHKIPVRVNLPGVGANLHDHTIVLGAFGVLPKDDSKRWFDMEIKALHEFLVNKTGPFKSPVGQLAVGFAHSPLSEDPKRPDLELVALDMALGEPINHGAIYKFGLKPEDIPAFAENCKNSFSFSPDLMRSKTRGKVLLKSTSIQDHPVFDIQYLSDPSDVKIHVEGLKYILKTIEAMKPLGITPTMSRAPGCDQDMDTDEYLECHVKSLTVSVWHMAGTCRIGRRDDPLAVVDKELRVIGVPNLRVIDASVIPEETTGHMVATVYGVAERGAEIILDGLKSNREEL